MKQKFWSFYNSQLLKYLLITRQRTWYDKCLNLPMAIFRPQVPSNDEGGIDSQYCHHFKEKTIIKNKSSKFGHQPSHYGQLCYSYQGRSFEVPTPFFFHKNVMDISVLYCCMSYTWGFKEIEWREDMWRAQGELHIVEAHPRVDFVLVDYTHTLEKYHMSPIHRFWEPLQWMYAKNNNVMCKGSAFCKKVLQSETHILWQQLFAPFQCCDTSFQRRDQSRVSTLSHSIQWQTLP